MTDSPSQECQVLVLISFFREETRGKRLNNRRQMSHADCKLGQGGPFQRHRGSQENKAAISYGHITEGLGRLRLNDCKELGKLQATGKPQPRIIATNDAGGGEGVADTILGPPVLPVTPQKPSEEA